MGWWSHRAINNQRMIQLRNGVKLLWTWKKMTLNKFMQNEDLTKPFEINHNCEFG